MIFSLPKSLRSTISNVLSDGKPVAYSWGNTDALQKWLVSKNNSQVDQLIGINDSVKYPLIWLVEGSQAKEENSIYVFEKVVFWISCNSKAETLNENRDFTIQYKVANELIYQLSKTVRIGENSIKWSEKSNVSTKTEQSPKSDIWDSVILTLDLRIHKSCLKKLIV